MLRRELWGRKRKEWAEDKPNLEPRQSPQPGNFGCQPEHGLSSSSSRGEGAQDAMPPRRGKKPVVLNSDSDIEIVVPSPAVSRIRKAPKRYSPNPSPVKPSRREPSASVAPPQQQLPSPPRLQPSPAKSESPAPPAPPPPRLPSRTVSREAQQLPVASTSAAAALPSPPPPRQSSSAPVASTSRVKLPVPRVKAKPKPKTKEVNSDDALDTFFTRKPVAKGRVPQSRRPGAGTLFPSFSQTRGPRRALRTRVTCLRRT